jgi:L-cysteine:1D-myo-inositol 2-amino-2-deoxy-alpha-D-glucopyranoside ligase
MNSWPNVAVPKLNFAGNLPALRLSDTARGSIEEVARKDLYRIYVCGITPYDATHLGHAATYLTFDLINRYLRASGATVRFVQNITDIDDPLLERALRDGLDWRTLAQSQIDLFRGDMVNLHVIPPDHYIGVVEAMPLVTDSIQTLIASGTTYFVEKDLYFKVRSDNDFGRRSHLSQEQMLSIFAERGGDPQRPGKSDPLDALLWLSHREGEPEWDSAIGSGRPGWHIECCAIALHYLAPDSHSATSIDIQGGGSDLIFPHHEMSAAQSKAINGKEFAEHYVHAGMIALDGVKMSKSLGNLVFVSDLIRDGHSPEAIRWALMSSHYSEDRNWSSDLLNAAENWVARLRVALSMMEVAPTIPVIQQITSALSENLDTPKALALLQNWIEVSEAGAIGGEAGELSRAIDGLLGLTL